MLQVGLQTENVDS
jgi:hypothetical protein